VALLYCVTHFFSFHFCLICHFPMLTHICPEEGGSMSPPVTDSHPPDHSAMSCPRQPQYMTLWSLFMYLQQNLNTISSAITYQISVPQPFKTGHYHFLPMLYSTLQHTPIARSYDSYS
jgi:hypothetical protein